VVSEEAVVVQIPKPGALPAGANVAVTVGQQRVFDVQTLRRRCSPSTQVHLHPGTHTFIGPHFFL
jgi:hypothetical protein